MERRVLTQKISMLIFTALFFIYGINAVSYANLAFEEGDTTTREIAENTPECRDIGAPLIYSAEGVKDCINIRLRGLDARLFAFALPFRGGIQLKTETALDFEKKNLYEVTFSITDVENPDDTDTITVNIIVTNVNEPPVFTGNYAYRRIPENTPAGVNIGLPVSAIDPDDPTTILTYRLGGRDADMFEIDSETGQLRTKAPLDYEAFANDPPSQPRSHLVVVEVSDGITSAKTDIWIDIEPVNEAPVFSEHMDEGPINLAHRRIPENTPAGVNIGLPVSAIDPDGSEVTYILSGANADMFEIDTQTGQLRTKMPLDYEAFESDPRTYFVEVEASDGKMSAITQVWIDVEPVNEFPPVFVEGDTATREIDETTEIGVSVGEPLTAIDMDAGETLEYSISNTDTEAFEIDSRTGQLRAITEMDYESKPVHTLKVGASDGSRTDCIMVTVRIIPNIVEVPDRSLAATIRRTLGLTANDYITEQAMLELTTLDADGDSRGWLGEIEDLTGLEYAKNLTTLLLTSNSVRDLMPLTGLTKLTRLEIYGNKVVFLTPLKDLTNLTKLELGYNWIHDITPLAGLTNLTELLLRSNNRIKDITPLQGLTNLRTLDLGENLITDIRPLQGLTNLRTLSLAYNARLTDISPLAGLVNLETLRLNGCAITDFSPLAGLTVDVDIDVPGRSAPAMNKNGISTLLDPAALKTLDRETLQVLLQRLYAENDGSLKDQRAIAMLESILASMRPNKTVLLANYPNPFNPETWIPYHLAKSTDVEITIYNAHGVSVRHLELGHQSSGYYTSRSQAAYWDGKNDFGERVATGIYFYQMQADTISPIRKMVILK